MRLFLKISLGFLIMGLPQWAPAQAGRVLVVHSYHQNYDWVKGINESIETAFKVRGVPYRFFYMDTKRKPSENWKLIAAQMARDAVAEYDPQVVIAVDDNAQAYFVRDYVNKSPIQFVFCGVNASLEQYNYPATNITGILERTHFGQSLHTLKAVIPQTRRVAVVSDSSTTSNLVLQRIKGLPTTFSPDTGIDVTHYIQPKTFAKWKQVIQTLEQDPHVDALLIPLIHTIKKEGATISMDPNKVLDWTLRHCSKPMVGLWPFFVNGGGLLAVTIDPKEHGLVAAQMALQILDGKKAGQIPIEINRTGRVVINLMNKEHLAFDPNLNLDQIADEVIR